MCVSFHVGVHECGGERTYSGVIPWVLSTPCFLRQHLSLAWTSPSKIGQPCSDFQGFTCLFPLTGVTQAPDSYIASGDGTWVLIPVRKTLCQLINPCRNTSLLPEIQLSCLCICFLALLLTDHISTVNVISHGHIGPFYLINQFLSFSWYLKLN